MLNKLIDQKHTLEARLATARQQYGEAAYASATTIDNKAAQKLAATLSSQAKLLESEIETMDAAILHAEKLDAEERRIAQELARQRAAEERKRALQRARSAMEQTTQTAAEIDKLINALGDAYQKWRAEFDAASGAVESLVGSSSATSGVGRNGLRAEIRDRLVGVGIIDDPSLTSERRAAMVSDAAHTFAFPFINAANNNDKEV